MRVARLAVVASLITVVLCSFASLATAQVTTANVRGSVKSADDGVPMAGAEVTLVDESTGSVKTATTNADGSFAFTNLQVGGPYHVTATVMGFKSAEEKNIFLTSNKTRDVALGLRLAEEVIEVSGTSIARTTSGRTVVTAAEIDALPSVGRDPRDLVRRNPEVSVEGKDRTLSIGGNNTRFNSITVDGIRQDDDFGLNASGYPTRRSPIALSAVQELTVESSPFDVHFGKFLGGNVNIVTKSGTNEFKGSLVGTYSSDSLLGNRSRDDRINVDYSEVRYGGTVGGPIIKDKLHFLISAEGLNATTPVSVGPKGSGATNIVSRVSQFELENVVRIAKEMYGFEAGVPARSLNEGDLKLLSKLDWAINKQHRASVIYQRTGGNSIQNGTASDTFLPLSSNWYDARDTLNTFSGRLFSDWSDRLSTQLEVNTKLVSSLVPPLNGNGFMAATIRTCGQDPVPGMSDGLTCAAGVPTGTIALGPDEFRHLNTLDNDIFHTKAEANYLSGNHLVTAGAEYELLMIKNLFVPGSNGVVQFPSLAAFEAKHPNSIRYFNAIKTNPDGTTTLDASSGAANWNSGTWTGYIQDQYKLTPEVTLQGGLRLEVYQTHDKITRNQNFVDRNGFDNTATLNGLKILMPRIGFSYLPIDKLNLRGGIGLYSGGTPSVWVSNNYTNDGVRTSTATLTDATQANKDIIYNFDGRNIPDGLAALVKQGNGNVDALDPDFKLPSAWKFGTGADYSLDLPGIGDAGKNIEMRVNYTYSKTLHGVTWNDLRRDNPKLPNNDVNLPIGTTPDGRPLYAAGFLVNRGYDMLLTNTSHGYGHVASLQVQKGFPFGLFVAASYAYQDVHEVNPGTSSRSVSNYGLAAVGDPNDPSDAISNYQRKHRFTGAAEFSRALVGQVVKGPLWKEMKTSVGMFIESRSGQPFSWTFGATENVVGTRTDANGTKLGKIFGEDTTFSSRNRELFYVPIPGDRLCTQDMITTGCQVVLATGPNGITKAQFNSFLEKTGLLHYRGQVVPRNSSTSPWFTKIDMRFAQDLPNPLSGHRARFLLDLENVGNLLNTKWGRAQAVPFPYATPAVDLDYDRVNNRYVYSNLRSTNPTRVDVLQSVWRVSLGLQYDF
jgi:Carboxypeptidase regulatory-like domain/TonB-dependent Receptor Plug Domain